MRLVLPLVLVSLTALPAEAQIPKSVKLPKDLREAKETAERIIEDVLQDDEAKPADKASGPPAEPGPESVTQPAATAEGEFTATWTPWVVFGPQNRLVDRAEFTGLAVVTDRGGPKKDAVAFLFCDPESKKSIGGMTFSFGRFSDLAPGEYTLTRRIGLGDVLGGFPMLPMTTFKEGSVTLASVGSDFVTGTARATYTTNPTMRLSSGTPPKSFDVEVSFRGRVVSEAGLDEFHRSCHQN